MCIKKLIGRFGRGARDKRTKAEPENVSAEINDMIREIQQKLLDSARENGRPRTGA